MFQKSLFAVIIVFISLSAYADIFNTHSLGPVSAKELADQGYNCRWGHRKTGVVAVWNVSDIYFRCLKNNEPFILCGDGESDSINNGCEYEDDVDAIYNGNSLPIGVFSGNKAIYIPKNILESKLTPPPYQPPPVTGEWQKPDNTSSSEVKGHWEAKNGGYVWVVGAQKPDVASPPSSVNVTLVPSASPEKNQPSPLSNQPKPPAYQPPRPLSQDKVVNNIIYPPKVVSKELSLDLHRYCKDNFGAGWTAGLQPNGGVNDWFCQTGRNDRRGMNLKEGCRQQHGVDEIHFRDERDPNSWYCVKQVTELSLDLSKYCKDNFGSEWAVGLQPNGGVNDWFCQMGKNERQGMNLREGCRQQHGTTEIHFRDEKDPNSWYCVK